ncbi:MAG: hypothetical protein IPO59_23540 [Betaproteobacteria bacterium]|nr:hypothetical protein [Betaproteobacteria bacterium]
MTLRAYGAANSFNYIDFYNDRFSLDLSQRLIEFRVKGENHPPNTVALQLYSTSTNGFLQYDLTASDLDGEWRHLSLSLGRFSSYGTNPRPAGHRPGAVPRHRRRRGAALTGSMLVNDLVARSVAEARRPAAGGHWHWPRLRVRRAGVARGAGRQLTPLIKGGAGCSSAGVCGVSGLAFRRGAVLFACGGGCLTCPSPACQQRRPGPG